ncbi:MAG: glycosyltransferase [Clostridiales bacterium]|nr:glycosyltransferase [Clostridiales bacterium]
MRVWIVAKEGRLPLQPGVNTGRMGALATYLSTHGHTVVWWTSTFVHATKEHLYDENKVLNISDTFTMILLHSNTIYKKNTSIKRVLYNDCLSKELNKEIYKYDKPDLIFCAYPSEQLCRVALSYAKQFEIPVIIDARDQWPDIFERAFPNALRWIASIALLPMKKRAQKAFTEATAICAVSPGKLQWALDYACREKMALDRYIFIGCSRAKIEKEALDSELKEWKNRGISEKTWNICVFTTLSKSSMDMDTVINAVRMTHKQYPMIRLIIGGKGDDEQRLIDEVGQDDYIHMMGWMNQLQMTSLMSISKAGMLCYRNTKDFKDGWGNKVGQYLSYGLPVLTSATGFSKQYVEQYGCGFAYEENNPESLEKIFVDLITNTEKQRLTSQRAIERFETDFENGVVMGQFEDMIVDVYESSK